MLELKQSPLRKKRDEKGEALSPEEQAKLKSEERLRSPISKIIIKTTTDQVVPSISPQVPLLEIKSARGLQPDKLGSCQEAPLRTPR